MNIQWTHKAVVITDVRKVRKFYILSIDEKKVTSPLFVDQNIFEGRVNSYYLRDSFTENGQNNTIINRDEVLKVKWNMVITQGYYIKINSNKEEEKIFKDEDKFYVSFLEIDGPLGQHISN